MTEILGKLVTESGPEADVPWRLTREAISALKQGLVGLPVTVGLDLDRIVIGKVVSVREDEEGVHVALSVPDARMAEIPKDYRIGPLFHVEPLWTDATQPITTSWKVEGVALYGSFNVETGEHDGSE